MDPLTTLLAAAAATGPNTLQSQALTALRCAGPQESFFTRMGNPHPLQLQQLAQPVTPQLSPIIAQPTSAPTALSQQPPMPILPLASPLADPAPTALHIPTLQAIQRMQQQTNPAAAMMPMMQQTPTTQPQAALPTDPTEYTQANFPSLTPRQLAVLAQLADSGRGTCAEHGTGPHTAHQHYFTPFRGRTRHTAPTSIRATHAPSALQGSQQEPYAATAPTPSPIQEPPPRPTIPQPQSAQSSPAPTQDPSVQIPKPPQP